MAAAHSVLAVVLLFTVYGAAPDDIITSQSVFYLYWFPKLKKLRVLLKHHVHALYFRDLHGTDFAHFGKLYLRLSASISNRVWICWDLTGRTLPGNKMSYRAHMYILK